MGTSIKGRGLEGVAGVVRPWGLGGSDIGAILGLSPHRGPVQVWLEKVNGARGQPCPLTGNGGVRWQGGPQADPGAPGAVASDPGFAVGRSSSCDEGIHLRYGRYLEPFVAQEYERVTGNTTHLHPQTVRHPRHPHLFAHLDRLVSSDGSPVLSEGGRIRTSTLLECKTASAFSAGQWGASWGDQVPPAYLAQCAWYTTLTGCECAHLAVLLGNSELRVYEVRHDQELGEALVRAALRFWDEHVMTADPPPARTRAEVQALYPREVSGRALAADQALLGHLRRLARVNGLAKRLELEAGRIKDIVAVQMQGAESITHAGKTLATWRATAPSRRLDQARLRRERPEVYSAYTVESVPSRRLVLGGACGE